MAGATPSSREDVLNLLAMHVYLLQQAEAALWMNFDLMLESGRVTVEDCAGLLGISRSSFYRRLHGYRNLDKTRPQT